jgi:TetR/AcrR family transcriptional regulator, transcriptional repressor for nem operon
MSIETTRRSRIGLVLGLRRANIVDYCYNPHTGLVVILIWSQIIFEEVQMGYSQAQKEKTHERIVAIASKRFREKGLARFGIVELMKEAGLTVGGFYKHFDSRDELVAEALSDAFGVWQRQKGAAELTLSLEKLIDDYVSDVHRKNPGAGCAFSALAPEIARSDKQTRALTSDQVKADLELIVGLLPNKDKRKARSRAILTFSALVGAMSLARAVSDEALSREILKTVAHVLKRPA